MAALPGARPVRAARGTSLTAKSWATEAPLRMLQNNLDPDVAEDPDNLVVYGGTGRAARDWASFDAICRELTDLDADQTLLVQSGRPVGVLRTHEWAPRVLIANSHLVPDWATWPEFRRLEALGLTMYGQMTAGSWIYIGSQGIVQGTYETFAAVAAQAFGGSLAGTLTVTAGLGGMGGAQPLAVTLNGGVVLCIEVDPERARRRVQTRYLDEIADDLDDGVARVLAAKAQRKALSVGVLGNAAEVLPELLRRGVAVDIVTDQTSAHDPLAYLPTGVDLADWHDYATAKPDEFTDRARDSMAEHVAAMVGFADAGAQVFDYGNSIRGEALLAGYERAFDFPGFVPAYIRPLFCAGKGPFRWVALSGDPSDIAATDTAVRELFPDDDGLQRWMRLAPERIAFQGLPARICWLGAGERQVAGLRFNQMVAEGTLSAPIVIGRDHLDAGSVASPYRETEAMADGSDAIADWPLLNALTATASGATWVSLHHGGGVGIGRSIHAGQVSVADGTALAGRKLERVLTNDPMLGVLRHVDAGYPEADAAAARLGVTVPMATAAPAGGAVKTAASSPESRFTSAWADLAGIGRDPIRGGFTRHAFDDAELQLREWFFAQAGRRGLATETDRNGNLWAWWGDRPGEGAGPAGQAVVTGSHLDSVPGGGAFDGPLGVVSALLAVDELRVRGTSPRRPLAIVCFTEEEGGRFGVPCLGSRLLTGAVDPDAARKLHDLDGIGLPDAARRAGLDPDHLGAEPDRLAGIGCFVELHVEQGKLMTAHSSAPVAVGSEIAAHGRWRLTFAGQGNHAGTTRPGDRHDPMIPAAGAVLAARRSIRRHPGAVATVGRIRPLPGGTNVIASTVDLWLDARWGSAEDTAALVDEIVAAVRRDAEAEGCTVVVHRESMSDRVDFDAGLGLELAGLLDAPIIATGAGHDAGVLAAVMPTAMLFVRNPTGISHAPAEHAETADCLAGISALADVLQNLLI